jgi:hypothetical protein
MGKNPENTGAPEKLSDEEVQKLIDGLPKSDELIRNDLQWRLQTALGILIKDNSWLELKGIIDAFAYKTYEERFMTDYVKTLPAKDRERNFISHSNNDRKIKELMAESLGYSVEIFEKLLRCDLEMQRIEHVEFYRLRADATFGQMGIWRNSIDAFEREHDHLRTHFIDRLRTMGLTLSDETSWNNINELVGQALIALAKRESDNPRGIDLLKMLGAVHPDDMEVVYDQFCVEMGFPAGQYNDLCDCIEKGMSFERQYQLKNFIDKKDSEDAERLKGWILGIGEGAKEVAGLLKKYGEDPHQALNAVFLYYLKKTVERLDLPIGCDDLPDDAPYEEIQNLLEAVTVAIQIQGGENARKELLDFVGLCTILTECGSEECASAVQKLHDALAMK